MSGLKRRQKKTRITHRNARAGCCARSRRPLDSYQRHSGSGKRIPEEHWRRRDGHNCVKRQNQLRANPARPLLLLGRFLCEEDLRMRRSASCQTSVAYLTSVNMFSHERGGGRRRRRRMREFDVLMNPLNLYDKESCCYKMYRVGFFSVKHAKCTYDPMTIKNV